MIPSPSATLTAMATVRGRRLLIGRVAAAIAADSYVVLVKADGTAAYRLIQVSSDPNDRNDPSTLASFLSPDEVDHSELTHALALADEMSRPKPKRKPRKRSKAGGMEMQER